MPITVDHIEELEPLVALVGSLDLSQEQRALLLDGCRRALHEHTQRHSTARVAVHETGLGPAPGASILPLREAERRHLVAALRHTGGKIYGRDGAAKLLALKPTTLQSKLKKHGISRLGALGPEGAAEGSSSTASSDDDDDASNERTPSSARPSAAAPLPAE